MDTAGIDSMLATAAREMDDAAGSTEVLRVATDWAVSLVPGCDMAGVTLRRRRGRVESVAPSDPAVSTCDDLQHDLDEGPCLDAIRDEAVILSPDAAADSRWPRWGPAVSSRHGVTSMLSVRLFSSDAVHGALNLYSRRRAAFDDYGTDIARLLATHVSVALRSALSEENLRLAVDSRSVIGQAQGILMERFSLDAIQAFALLSRISQDRNIRLIDVAEHVARRRELPGVATTSQLPGV